MVVTIKVGHVLTELAKLPAESVHCVWTSVPYYGLRSYGTEPQIWGGDADCPHEWHEWHEWHDVREETEVAKSRTTQRFYKDPSRRFNGNHQRHIAGQFCKLCAAWRGEHGLEPDLGVWLDHEVLIWRAVRRVLRQDGTVWLNVGDAYATSANGRPAAETKAIGDDDRTFRDKPFSTVGGAFKAKDRLMMPARLAIHLHEDGWFIRDEIVWFKKNPMPSSIKDRTTPAHEMLYLLTKSARYFYDQAAIREPLATSSIKRLTQPTIMDQKGGKKADAYEEAGLNDRTNAQRPNEIVQGMALRLRQKPSGWDTAAGGHSSLRRNAGDERKEANPGFWEGADRNKRSVWSIATEPFPEAHFATAPSKLVEPCIKAGTPEFGVCASCGAPWKRIIAKTFIPQADVSAARSIRGHDDQKPMDESNGWQGYARGSASHGTTGWAPTCKCEINTPVPATVLDPFGGAGTTGLVADRLGRNAILIELKPEYAALAATRLTGDAGFMAEVKVE